MNHTNIGVEDISWCVGKDMIIQQSCRVGIVIGRDDCKLAIQPRVVGHSLLARERVDVN